MVETFLLALFTLLIALYIQARKSAREIRRNRETHAGTNSVGVFVNAKPARVKPFGIF